MPKNHPSKPHDEFFKATFGRLDVALEYLQQMLPVDIQNNLQLNALERINGSFVSQELKEYFSDVVYQCPIVGLRKQAFLTFILEHKSNLVKHPHFQLLRYMLDTWDDQIKNKQPLTPIIPVVLYQGKRKWIKRDVYAYFDKKLPTSFRPFCPNFDYFLTDVRTLSDEQILELNKGLLINTLLMMKHIWEPEFVLQNPDLIFVHLEDDQYSDFQISILAYFFRNADIAEEKVQTFIKALPIAINKNAMSTYDMIVEKGVAKGIELGREEGRAEGREEMLIKTTREMLLKGFEYHLIMDILHVESEFIDEIREALLLEQEGFSTEEVNDNPISE